MSNYKCDCGNDKFGVDILGLTTLFLHCAKCNSVYSIRGESKRGFAQILKVKKLKTEHILGDK